MTGFSNVGSLLCFKRMCNGLTRGSRGWKLLREINIQLIPAITIDIEPLIKSYEIRISEKKKEQRRSTRNKGAKEKKETSRARNRGK